MENQERNYKTKEVDVMVMLDCPEPPIVWVSECCTALPIGELDMSSISFGGPSGCCSRCQDNCIFIVEKEA